MTARPIRRNAQTPDRNGKIFYTSTTSLSHISKMSRDEAAAKEAEVAGESREVRELVELKRQMEQLNYTVRKQARDVNTIKFFVVLPFVIEAIQFILLLFLGAWLHSTFGA